MTETETGHPPALAHPKLLLRQACKILCEQYREETIRAIKDGRPDLHTLRTISSHARTGLALIEMVKQVCPPLKEVPEKTWQDIKREDDELRAKLENILRALCEEDEEDEEGEATTTVSETGKSTH